MNSIIPKGSIIASFVYEKSSNLDGYEDMDKKTLEEVKKIDGYLGHEVFGDGHRNIFLSYWRDEDSINACNELGISMMFTGKRHFLH